MGRRLRERVQQRHYRPGASRVRNEFVLFIGESGGEILRADFRRRDHASPHAPRSIGGLRRNEKAQSGAPDAIGDRRARFMQREEGFARGVRVGLIAGQLRPSSGWLAHRNEIAPSGVDLIRARACPNKAKQPERGVFGGYRPRPNQPLTRATDAGFIVTVIADSAHSRCSRREHAARMRRAEIGRNPVAVALPMGQTACIYGGCQIRRHAGCMGRHQQVAVVRSRVVEIHGLHGIIEGRRTAERPKRLRLDCAEDRGIEADAALAGHLKRQDGEDIVMAGDAGAFGDESGGRMFERRESTVYSLADFRSRLGAQSVESTIAR